MSVQLVSFTAVGLNWLDKLSVEGAHLNGTKKKLKPPFRYQTAHKNTKFEIFSTLNTNFL